MTNLNLRTGARLRRALPVLCGLWLAAGTAWAAAPEIRDDGEFFSAGTRQRANQIIDDIYRKTTPHKDVVVETYATVPGGQSAESFIESRFRSRTVDGLMIVATKRPKKKLLITVGRRTEDRFTAADARRMREIMLARFAKGDFDGGLIDGLEFAQRSLVAAFPATSGTVRGPVEVRPPPVRYPSTPYRPEPAMPVQRTGCGGASILGILLVVGLIWLIFGLIRGIWRAVSGSGRGPVVGGGGNYGGGGTLGGGGYTG